MRKVAATILALALATTHGLLEEGGPNVQKKDAIKEGYPARSRRPLRRLRSLRASPR